MWRSVRALRVNLGWGINPSQQNRPRKPPLISPHKPEIDRRRQITWHRRWAACAKHHSTPKSIGGVQETATCTVARQKQNHNNEGWQLIPTPITDHTGNQSICPIRKLVIAKMTGGDGFYDEVRFLSIQEIRNC